MSTIYTCIYKHCIARHLRRVKINFAVLLPSVKVLSANCLHSMAKPSVAIGNPRGSEMLYIFADLQNFPATWYIQLVEVLFNPLSANRGFHHRQSKGYMTLLYNTHCTLVSVANFHGLKIFPFANWRKYSISQRNLPWIANQKWRLGPTMRKFAEGGNNVNLRKFFTRESFQLDGKYTKL